jgi:hypothetical protein
VVPDIENIRAKFHQYPFAEHGLFVEAHVRLIDSRTAANGSRSISNCSGGDSVVCKKVGIKRVP